MRFSISGTNGVMSMGRVDGVWRVSVRVAEIFAAIRKLLEESRGVRRASEDTQYVRQGRVHHGFRRRRGNVEGEMIKDL